MNKKCTRCRKTKPFSEFTKYKNGEHGLDNRCRECKRVISGIYWSSRSRSDYLKKWRKENPEKVKLHDVRLRSKYPAKHKARTALNNATRAGKLPRAGTLKCIRCGNQAKHYHHHKGYAKEHWLDVLPVCIPCHHIVERGE